MQRLTLFLPGLIATLTLLVVGCSSDDGTDQATQEQTQAVATQQQEIAEPSPQPTTQVESEAVAEPQEPQQEQEQPATHEQAEQTELNSVEQAEQEQSTSDEVHQERQDQPQQRSVGDDKISLGGSRPATLLIPKHADRSEPRPLIVLLHGYGSRSSEADAYFQFSQWIDEYGFGLLLPDGTIDAITNRHWNATDECCDLFGAETDDVGYIKSLIEEARSHAEFDRIFAVGHSNGGFMAYRLACEAVPGLTAIVSLAGGAFANAEDCRVPTPISVLQIHGTEDQLVLYDGGRLPIHPDPDRAPVPGAWESVTRWAMRAGCRLDAVLAPARFDADTAVPGSETTVKHLSHSCVEGTVMELWTIEGGGHVPLVWETQFTHRILEWLEDVYVRASDADAVEERLIGGERSARLLLPVERGSEPLPLILLLHGYQGGRIPYFSFGISDQIRDYHFALIIPLGTTDARGNNFWNATDACCNFDGSDVDDYGWLSGLVAEAREIIEVSGVFAVGYSNGGFMAYRLACDGLDGLVAIASVAGSSFGDPDRCASAAPVSVLQVHGTNDVNIPFAGTLESAGGYPGAKALIQRWGERADCDVELVEQLPNLDLEGTIVGPETTVRRIREGCADDIVIELWTIEKGDHFPMLQDNWPDYLLSWLFDHSRTG